MSPRRASLDNWIKRAAWSVGRARTLIVVLLVEMSWVIVNLLLSDRAFDPPPFRLLTRFTGIVSCAIIALAWSNARRLARAERARAVRYDEARAWEDELETLLRAAARPSRASTAWTEPACDEGRTRSEPEKRELN